MTIHADFVKILKTDCKQAFTDKFPLSQAPDYAFVDGQVKLMKPDSVQQWNLFIHLQFKKTVENLFKLGAQVVVMGFDNYNYVPVSKTMTQVKRNKYVPVLKFNEVDELPPAMPADWGGAMRNRAFKVKVIKKVVFELKQWFLNLLRTDEAWKKKILIIDADQTPEILHFSRVQSTLDMDAINADKHSNNLSNDAQNSVKDNTVDNTEDNNGENQENAQKDKEVNANELMQAILAENETTWIGRGECDIKAFYWLKYSNRLLVVSTDGDFVPIAMLQLQKMSHLHADINKTVILHRICAQVNSDTVAGKRKNEIANVSKKRTYEYVDISQLMHYVTQNMPSLNQSPITNFCALIAMCGCDFALNLPRLGPKTIWKFRNQLKYLDLTDRSQVVCAIHILYHNLFVCKNSFPAHVKNNSEFYKALNSHDAKKYYENTFTTILHSQRIAERVRTCLWTTDRTYAHAGNSMWTMLYWLDLQHSPHPHSADYGFSFDTKNRTVFAHA
jgi:hypothetical protein